MAVLCACNMETNVGWSPSQGGDYHQVIASKIIEQVLQLMKLKTHITPNQSNFIGKDENKNEWVSNTPIHVGKHTRILTLCDFFLTLTWHWFQEKFNNQILHLSIKLGRFSVLLFRNFETVFFFTILLPPYHFSCNPMWIKKNLKLFCQPWSRNSYRPIKKMSGWHITRPQM